MRFRDRNSAEEEPMNNAAIVLLSVIAILAVGCDRKNEPQDDTAITHNQDRPIPDFVGFNVGAAVPSLKKCETVDYGIYSSDGEAVCWWTADQPARSAGEAVLPDGHYMLEFPQNR